MILEYLLASIDEIGEVPFAPFGAAASAGEANGGEHEAEDGAVRMECEARGEEEEEEEEEGEEAEQQQQCGEDA